MKTHFRVIRHMAILWIALPLALLALTATAWAETRVIRFDEIVESPPVHGLSFQGVSFFFTLGGEASTDAVFGRGGPGSLLFVQDPSLEGNAEGILWLLFDTPTPFVVFGFSRSVFEPLQGVVVDLFGPNFAFIGRRVLVGVPLVPGGFAENLLIHQPSPVRLVRIIFPNAATAARFALDNLAFDAPPPAATSSDLTGTNIRLALQAGIEHVVSAPPLPEDVQRQLESAQPSKAHKPGSWRVK